MSATPEAVEAGREAGRAELAFLPPHPHPTPPRPVPSPGPWSPALRAGQHSLCLASRTAAPPPPTPSSQVAQELTN